MSAPDELEPELRNVLIELAERPELAQRLGRHLFFRRLISPEDLLSAGPLVGLEDQLLRAYRSELSTVLLYASRRALDSETSFVLPPRDDHGQLESIDWRRWEERQHALLQGYAFRSDPAHKSPLGLLLRHRDGNRRTPSSMDLAVAAMNVLPTTKAIMMVAHRLHLSGAFDRAQGLYLKALDGCSSEFLCSEIYSNLSSVACKQRRFHDAVEYARTGARLAPEPQRLSAAWLCAALQAGGLHEAKSAAAFLGECSGRSSAVIDEYAVALRASRRAGAWHPTREARGIAKTMEAPSATGERILAAFG